MLVGREDQTLLRFFNKNRGIGQHLKKFGMVSNLEEEEKEDIEVYGCRK